MKTFTSATAALAAIAGLTAAAPAPQTEPPFSPETRGWLVFNVESGIYANHSIILPRQGSSVPLEIVPRAPQQQQDNMIYGQLRGPSDAKTLFLVDDIVHGTRYEARAQRAANEGASTISATHADPAAADEGATFLLQPVPGPTYGVLRYVPRGTDSGEQNVDESFLACKDGRGVVFLQHGRAGTYGDRVCSRVTITARDLFITPCLNCDKD